MQNKVDSSTSPRRDKALGKGTVTSENLLSTPVNAEPPVGAAGRSRSRGGFDLCPQSNGREGTQGSIKSRVKCI